MHPCTEMLISEKMLPSEGNEAATGFLFPLELTVSEEAVLRRLGAGTTTGCSARTKRSVQKALADIRRLAQPRAVYRTVPLARSGAYVEVDGNRVRSRQLGRALGCCDEAVVFVLTLGHGVDSLIGMARAGQAARAAVFDVAASEAAESAAECFEATIRGQLPAALGATPRYSPGYCDWPLSQQQTLFSLLPPNPAGVWMTSERMMMPQKSVSGLIGIGPARLVAQEGNTCSRCRAVSCKHRRVAVSPLKRKEAA